MEPMKAQDYPIGLKTQGILGNEFRKGKVKMIMQWVSLRNLGVLYKYFEEYGWPLFHLFQLLQGLWPVCLFHIFSLQLMPFMPCWPLMQNNIFVTLVLSLLNSTAKTTITFTLITFLWDAFSVLPAPVFYFRCFNPPQKARSVSQVLTRTLYHWDTGGDVNFFPH